MDTIPGSRPFILVKKPGFLSFCAYVAFNANPQLLLETPPEIEKSFLTNKKEDEN